jgi:K+-sensing histidine kinase KdpD
MAKPFPPDVKRVHERRPCQHGRVDLVTKCLTVATNTARERRGAAFQKQIFWNLIENAVKFAPAEGRISIRSADTGTGRLVIEVADTGARIAPVAMQRISDNFVLRDRNVSRQHGGLGLGLAVAS